MKTKEAKKFLKRNKIERVRIIYPDLNGKMRGEMLSVEKFIDHMEMPGEVAEEIISMDMFGETHYVKGSVSLHESNVLFKPDLRTLTITPWLDNTAQVIMNLYTRDGKRWERDPRYLLEKASRRLMRKGMLPKIGTEVEFYLKKNGEDVVKTKEADRIEELSQIKEYLINVFEYSHIMGIDINKIHKEASSGEMEIALKHKSALRAADELFFFREMLDQVGKQFDFKTYFMPRMATGSGTCGCHAHFSLINRKGKNLFVNNGKETKLLQNVIGGLLKHLDAACAFYLPTINSYKRLNKGDWTPINKSFAHDNRFVSFRISETNDHSKNIENRICGIDINSYLAFAAYLTSAFLGIMNREVPQPETIGSPYEDETLEDLPRDLQESLDNLSKDELFVKFFSPEMVRLYIAMKRNEVKEFKYNVTQWELDHYATS